MNTKNKIKLSSDFKNPFDGRNPEEVWKELKEKSKPITREELLKRIEELQVLKKK
ncbi:MAG TPA: hypothetical protein VNW06_03250 [Cytophagaceae bacterium]|jgi:hypothetical protein|nr:hypothetical protein [Cytophagaceae bacterium]